MRARTVAALLLLSVAGFATGKWYPFGVEPESSQTKLYSRNAMEARHGLNDHPISRLLSATLVYQTSLSGFRRVEGSCDGGSDQALPEMTDMVAVLHDRTFFGLPLARYETSCAGLYITRGRIEPQPPGDGRSPSRPSEGPAQQPPRPPAA